MNLIFSTRCDRTLPVSRRPLILGSLLLAAFAINLDITIVNVALPSLVRELHASTSQLQWVVDAYSLVFAALILAAGSLSDRLGRKGFLLVGLGVFGTSSLAGGLTSSAGQLTAPGCCSLPRRWRSSSTRSSRRRPMAGAVSAAWRAWRSRPGCSGRSSPASAPPASR